MKRALSVAMACSLMVAPCLATVSSAEEVIYSNVIKSPSDHEELPLAVLSGLPALFGDKDLPRMLTGTGEPAKRVVMAFGADGAMSRSLSADITGVTIGTWEIKLSREALLGLEGKRIRFQVYYEYGDAHMDGEGLSWESTYYVDRESNEDAPGTHAVGIAIDGAEKKYINDEDVANGYTLSGTAEPYATVIDAMNQTAQTGADGVWSLQYATSLFRHGETYTFSIRYDDQKQEEAATWTPMVDRWIDDGVLLEWPILGAEEIAGFAEPGAQVFVDVGSMIYGPAQADELTGYFAIPVPKLTQVDETVAVTVRQDSAGNDKGPDGEMVIGEETVLAPIEIEPQMRGKTVIGMRDFMNGVLVLSGMAQPFQTLVDGENRQTVADASGAWRMEIPIGVSGLLHNQPFTFALRYADDPSDGAISWTPLVDLYVDDMLSIDQLLPGDTTVSGMAEPGARVTAQAGASTYGPAVADDAGVFSIRVSPLTLGAPVIVSIVEDRAGNTVNERGYVVTAERNVRPRIVIDANKAGKRYINGKDIATDFVLRGSAESGSLVSDGANTVVATGGRWSFTYPRASFAHNQGSRVTFVVFYGDDELPGGVSWSPTVDMYVAEPLVVDPPYAGSTRVTGTAESGASVSVWVDDTLYGTENADAHGAFAIEGNPLAADAWITVTVTDKAGNTTDWSGEPVEVALRVMAAISVEQQTIERIGMSDLRDGALRMSGAAEAGAEMVDARGTHIIAGDDGRWSIAYPAAFLEAYQDERCLFTLRYAGEGMDRAVKWSPVIDLYVDDILSLYQPLPGATTIGGIAEKGATVAAEVNGVAVEGVALTDVDTGAFTIDVPELDEGDRVVITVVDDGVGNTVASDGRPVTRAVEVIRQLSIARQDQEIAVINGADVAGGIFLLRGTAEPGWKVIDRRGHSVTPVSGAWSFGYPKSDVAADHGSTQTFTVRYADALPDSEVTWTACIDLYVDSLTVRQPTAGETRIVGWTEPGAMVRARSTRDEQTATAGDDGVFSVRVAPLGSYEKVTIAVVSDPAGNTLGADGKPVSRILLCLPGGRSDAAPSMGRDPVALE